MATAGANQIAQMGQNFIQGIQSGRDYALALQQNNRQEESLKLEREKLAMIREENENNKFMGLVTRLEAAVNGQLSGKIRNATVERYKQYAQQLGIPVSPVFEALTVDEAMAPKVASAVSQYKTALELGDSGMQAQIRSDLYDLIGSEDADQKLGQLDQNKAQIEKFLQELSAKRLEKMEERQFTMGENQKNREAAMRREQVKQEFSFNQEQRKRVDELGKQISAIDKDYRPQEQAVLQIKDFQKKMQSGKRISGNERVAILRLYQPLSEAARSVVREGEANMATEAIPIYEKAKFWAQKYTGQDVAAIPDAAVRDMMEGAKVLEQGIIKAKANQLNRIYQTIRENGLESRAKSILGEPNLKIIRVNQYNSLVEQYEKMTGNPAPVEAKKRFAESVGIQIKGL